MSEKLLPLETEQISLKEAYVEALFASGAVKIAPDGEHKFKMRNGGESWIYIDHGDTICSPETNKPFIAVLIHECDKLGTAENSAIVNIDSKSSPQTTGAIAAMAGYKQIAVLPDQVQQAEKGTKRKLRIPKNLDGVKQLIFIDDVMTSGETVIEVAKLVREELVKIIGQEKASDIQFHLVVGLARNPKKAVQRLKEAGIESHWTVELNEIIKKMWSRLTSAQQEGLAKEIPDLQLS